MTTEMPEKSDSDCAGDYPGHIAHPCEGTLCLSSNASWDTDGPLLEGVRSSSQTALVVNILHCAKPTEPWQELLEGATEVPRGEEKYGNKCDSEVPGPAAHTICGHRDSAGTLASSYPAPVAGLLWPQSCSAAWGQTDKAFFPQALQRPGEALLQENRHCEQPFPLSPLGSAGQEVTDRVVIPHLWMTHRSRCLLLGLTGSGPCSPLAKKMWFLRAASSLPFPSCWVQAF